MWYSAMKVFDDNTNTIWRYSGDCAYIAWPSQALPLEFLLTATLGVSLNHKEFDSTKTTKLGLLKHKGRREWGYRQIGEAPPVQGTIMWIRRIIFCIIFRPMEWSTVTETPIVPVENIYRLMGQAGISYYAILRA